MAERPRKVEGWAWRLLAQADALVNRAYGWKYNPLYQSGTVVVALLLLLLVTGVWLLLFYRVGDPHGSVARLTANPWWGSPVRSVHRYASDAAIAATLVHALRVFAQGRSWGPRTLAWASGVALLALTLVSGWTGFVMVWDGFGMTIAREGARMIDALPVLSEPISRAFTGERPVSTIFFFLNLFAHVGIPLSMLVVLWLHVTRLARPNLLPPRRLLWGTVGALVVLALARPVTMAPRADVFTNASHVAGDWFFGFWIPLTSRVSGGVALLALIGVFALAAIIPRFVSRRAAAAPKSHVDEEICVGCRQCFLDCPYEAIAMIRRDGERVRSEEVARVDPSLCVSCGICAGSCAPMRVGPPLRTGRDQLTRVREFIASPEHSVGKVVAVCCERGASRFGEALGGDGAIVYPVDCAGSLHTSVIELLVRSGTPGVLVLACPPRDCWNREGPKWLNERVYHDREAELQARVDRRRVRIAYANAAEGGLAQSALRAFQADLVASGIPVAERDVQIDLECVVVPVAEGEQ